MDNERICSRVSLPCAINLNAILTMTQSNVHFEPSSLQPTLKPARKTLSYQRLPTAPPSRTPSSSFPCPSSLFVFPRPIRMKATITPQAHTRQSESKAFGQSKSNNNKNAAKICTLSGYMKALKSSKSCMLLVL